MFVATFKTCSDSDLYTSNYHSFEDMIEIIDVLRVLFILNGRQ